MVKLNTTPSSQNYSVKTQLLIVMGFFGFIFIGSIWLNQQMEQNFSQSVNQFVSALESQNINQIEKQLSSNLKQRFSGQALSKLLSDLRINEVKKHLVLNHHAFRSVGKANAMVLNGSELKEALIHYQLTPRWLWSGMTWQVTNFCRSDRDIRRYVKIFLRNIQKGKWQKARRYTLAHKYSRVWRKDYSDQHFKSFQSRYQLMPQTKWEITAIEAIKSYLYQVTVQTSKGEFQLYFHVGGFNKKGCYFYLYRTEPAGLGKGASAESSKD